MGRTARRSKASATSFAGRALLAGLACYRETLVDECAHDATLTVCDSPRAEG